MMKRKLNGKRPYEAPQLTVVTFMTEQGFTVSNPLSLFVHQEEAEEVNTTFGRSGYGEATTESNTQDSWF